MPHNMRIHISSSKITKLLPRVQFPSTPQEPRRENEKVIGRLQKQEQLSICFRFPVLLACPALADSGFWGGLRPKDFMEGVTGGSRFWKPKAGSVAQLRKINGGRNLVRKIRAVHVMIMR